VLPLSLGAALLLLLSSLSVQTAVLHGHQLTAAELKQRQQDDALDSAAQQVAARLSGSYACLLPLDSAGWEPPVPGCPAALDPAPLRQGTVGGVGYRLVSWLPAAGELRLELLQAGGARRYALAVAPVSVEHPALHVVSVRGMGR
jgi:hypothetical protein